MREWAYVNGQFLPRENAKVHVEDRGYQFADGVYEVVRFHGRRGLRLDAHLERLQQSSAALRIVGGLTVEEWHSVIEQLMDHCELPDDENARWSLYLQVTRGATARNHPFPVNPVTPSAVAYFRPAPRYSPEQRATGMALSSQPDERWERCHIKSVALLPVVMAKQAAIEAGAFEALLIRNGKVTEGGATNAFCVRNGEVWTHPEGPHILSGITRTMVLEAAERVGVTVHQEAVSLEDFRAAEEAFISSTTMDIMPVTKLDGKLIADGQVGPVTQKLIEALWEIIAAETRAVPVGA